MLTRIPTARLRRALGASLGLAALWFILALARPSTTFHLAPFLVAGALPAILAYDSEDRISAQSLVLPALLALVGALATTAVLAALDAMRGPSLLPFGGAVTEAVIFAVAGTFVGVVAALLRR